MVNENTIKIAIKYCGSCNPQVEFRPITSHLSNLSGQGLFQIVPDPEERVDLLVILCGCPRACGNKEEFKACAGRAIVVAGNSLNGEAMTEKDLPSALEREIQKYSDYGSSFPRKQESNASRF